MARKFNGTGDMMSLPSGFNPLGSFSLGMWCNPASAPYRGARLTLSGYPGGTGFAHEFNSASPSVMLLLNPGVAVIGVSSGAIPDGTWVHLGLTWNATTYAYQFFTNGVLDGSGTASPFTIAAATNYFIGSNGPSPDYVYGGDMSDLAVWDTILPSAKFASLAAKTRANQIGLNANLIGYWPMLGLSPEPDKSGFGNDAVLSGTTISTDPPGLPPYSSTVAPPEISGTLATTEAKDTVAFAGTVSLPAVSGTLAVTEAKDTVAFSGTVSLPAVSGTFAITEATDIAAFAGNSGVSGTLATVEAKDVAAFAGIAFISGTLATTEAQDVGAFVGVVTGIVSGTLATVEAKDLVTIIGGSAVAPVELAGDMSPSTVLAGDSTNALLVGISGDLAPSTVLGGDLAVQAAPLLLAGDLSPSTAFAGDVTLTAGVIGDLSTSVVFSGDITVIGAGLDLVGDLSTSVTLSGNLLLTAGLAGNLSPLTVFGGDLTIAVAPLNLAGNLSPSIVMSGNLTLVSATGWVDLAGDLSPSIGLGADVGLAPVAGGDLISRQGDLVPSGGSVVQQIADKDTEKAVLVVNGQEFRDWESVMVRHAIREVPPYRFRFTCSEGIPIATNFAKMQIKPGDQCEVYLAGIKAISGKVSTRQVYYDKRRHYIEIQGATFTLDLSGSSPITKTMEHKDVNFEQLAKSLLKPYNIPFKVEGGQLPQFKFPRVSLMHGLSVLDHLDMYSRHVGAGFTSDANGSFVAIAGPGQGGDSVVEGENILVGREIIYNPSMESSAPAISQQTGSDQKSMAKVASVPYLNQAMQTLGKSFMPFVIPMEIPSADPQHMQGRASTERNWQAEDQITVFATVEGWLRPSGGLWERNQQVHVTSPMLIMDMDLTLKSATFTQDSTEGARTVLELCNPLALGGGTPQMQ
jgi:prophage tail gpP-like protein